MVYQKIHIYRELSLLIMVVVDCPSTKGKILTSPPRPDNVIATCDLLWVVIAGFNNHIGQHATSQSLGTNGQFVCRRAWFPILCHPPWSCL